MTMMEGTASYPRDPRRPRLRTAWDRKALEGRVPFAVGGNPTPAEMEAQRAHDARQATDPFSLPADIDPRAVPDPVSASQAAMRREAIPTLAEVMAAMPQVAQESGALMPGKLADRGERGFGGADENRDSADAEKLTALVRLLDRMAHEVLFDNVPHSVVRFAAKWCEIRNITQANTDRPNREGDGS